MRFRNLVISLAVALALLAPMPASAHPHGWIDLKTKIILDDEGRMVAIEQEWLFDEWYSVYATNGWDMEKESGRQALTELARANLKGLRDYDYFTEILLDGEKQTIADVVEFETTMRGPRIWMRMVTPLAEPLDTDGRSVSYRVYDPTYYIEVLHATGEKVAFEGDEDGGCIGDIVKPEPNPEAIALAHSVILDTQANDTVGQYFAETVTIRCN